MNKQLKLYKKIHRKYDANHWWLKDYKNHNIIINQNYINYTIPNYYSRI